MIRKTAYYSLGEIMSIFVAGIVVGALVITPIGIGIGVRGKDSYYSDMLMDQRKVDAYRAKVLAEEQFTKLTSNPERD